MLSERKFMLVSSGIIATLSVAMILARFFSADVLLSNDSYGYLGFTRCVLENGWKNAILVFPIMENIPPLLLLILLSGCKCGLDPKVFGVVVNCLGVFLTCQGVLFCSLKLYKNRITALSAAIMICSLPKIYIEGCNIQRDPLFWSESAWLLYVLLSIAKADFGPGKKEKRYGVFLVFAAALLSALACLTRKEGLFFFCLSFFSIMIMLSRKKTLSVSVAVVMISIPLLVAVFIVYLPWLCGLPFLPGSFLK